MTLWLPATSSSVHWDIPNTAETCNLQRVLVLPQGILRAGHALNKYETSRRRSSQILKPPQLPPFNVKEEHLHSKPLPKGWVQRSVRFTVQSTLTATSCITDLCQSLTRALDHRWGDRCTSTCSSLSSPQQTGTVSVHVLLSVSPSPLNPLRYLTPHLFASLSMHSTLSRWEPWRQIGGANSHPGYFTLGCPSAFFPG